MTIEEKLTTILTSSLTGREARLLCFLLLHPEVKTQQALASAFGLSAGTINILFAGLYEKGIISRQRQGRVITAYNIHFQRIQQKTLELAEL